MLLLKNTLINDLTSEQIDTLNIALNSGSLVLETTDDIPDTFDTIEIFGALRKEVCRSIRRNGPRTVLEYAATYEHPFGMKRRWIDGIDAGSYRSFMVFKHCDPVDCEKHTYILSEEEVDNMFNNEVDFF